MIRENVQVVKLRERAQELKLEFIVEKSISLKEPVIAIVNKRAKTMKAVSRNMFAQEQKITWVDTFFPSEGDECVAFICEKLNKNYSHLIKEVNECEKALLDTDYGYGVTNLLPIKKGQYVVTYEGRMRTEKYQPYFFDDEKKSEILKYRLLLSVPKENDDGLSIDAVKFRGFGGYMQSLITLNEKLNYYEIESKHSVALANLAFNRDTPLLPCYQAEEDIPSLSLLGISYRLKYFQTFDISPVPFSQIDGFSVPYEISKYEVYFKDKSLKKEYRYGLPATISKETMLKLISKIKKEKVIQLGCMLLQEAEMQQMERHIENKHIKFDILIRDTPAILILKAAYSFCMNYFFSLEKNINNETFIPGVTQLLKICEKILRYYDYYNLLLSSKKSDEETAPLLEYFNHQNTYFSACHVILQQIVKHKENKSSAKEKIEKIAKKYPNLKSNDYPLLFRNLAVNCQILDLWCLIKENKAVTYINEVNASLGKSPLHLAVESKKGLSDKMATCLLLLEFKADPNLKDKQSNTPLGLIKDKPLSFLFRRVKEGFDPDGVGKEINAAAAKQGYSTSELASFG